MLATSSRGSYFDGRTATRHAVTVTVTGSGLRITRDDGGAVEWPYGEIRQPERFHAGERVRLERGRPIPEILEVDDEGLLAAIERFSPATRPRFRSSFRRSTWIMLALLAGVGALSVMSVLYLWGIPAFADAAASRVPVAWEEHLGQALVEQVAPVGQRCADAGRLRIVDQIVARLRTGAPPSPYTFHITVLRGPIVNALAAPGGYIVVYHGLLIKTKTPEELAGVLAHEMQHVMQRHATKAFLRNQSMRVLFSAVSGNVAGLNSALHAAETLGQLRYSRTDEEAADREGMKMLQRAGVDPAGMVNFFRTLEQEQAGEPRAPVYVSTHPPIRARIETLQRLAVQAGYAPMPLVPGYPWSEISKICRTLH